jgi:SsrA-binding protein
MSKKINEEYTLLAKVILYGPEVKPILKNEYDIRNGYCVLQGSQIYICGMHVHPDKTRDQFSKLEPNRDRNLCITKSEFRWLKEKVQKGYIILPKKVTYVKGKIRIELTIGKPIKKYDKREVEIGKIHRKEMLDF